VTALAILFCDVCEEIRTVRVESGQTIPRLSHVYRSPALGAEPVHEVERREAPPVLAKARELTEAEKAVFRAALMRNPRVQILQPSRERAEAQFDSTRTALEDGVTPGSLAKTWVYGPDGRDALRAPTFRVESVRRGGKKPKHGRLWSAPDVRKKKASRG
jgi:hypothetical protein